MKVCPCCKESKPLTEFGIDRKRSDLKNVYCAPCIRAKSAFSRNSDLPTYREKHAAWRKSCRTSPRYRASRLLTDARTRHTEVTVGLDWVDQQISSGTCAVTGISFDLGGHGAPARPFTPSLDRIDPKLGYTPENTQVVCWVYNRAKGVHGHDAVLTMAKALCHVQ